MKFKIKKTSSVILSLSLLFGFASISNLSTAASGKVYTGPLISAAVSDSKLAACIDKQKLRSYEQMHYLACTAKVKSLDGLENHVGLERANFHTADISDLEPLRTLSKLWDLQVSWNELTDISPLADITSLKVLELYNNDIVDLSPLANLSKLSTLKISRNDIVDLSPLSNLTRLYTLTASKNDIVDVSPLAPLTRLRTLWLTNNEITDVSSLSSLVNLTKFMVSGNNIEDISVIRYMPNLTMLAIDSTLVTDLSPLLAISPSAGVYIGGNPQLTCLNNITLQGSQGYTTVAAVIDACL